MSSLSLLPPDVAAPSPRLQRRWLAALVGLGLWGLAAPATEAATMLTGIQPVLETGRTVEGDLYVAGLRASLKGRVKGDVFILGGEVHLDGPVGGSVNVVGGDVSVQGGVGHAVRGLASDLLVGGAVGGDLLAAAGGVTSETTTRVGGESRLRGTELFLQGNLGRTLNAQASDLYFNGHVTGAASFTAPHAIIGPLAVVGGLTTLETAHPAPIAEGAELQGGVERMPWVSTTNWGSLLGWAWGYSSAWCVGVFALWLLPGLAEQQARIVAQFPGWRFVLGLAVLIGLPFVAIFLMVTVIGLPLGLLTAGVYLASLYLSQIVVGWSSGRALLGRRLALTGLARRALALAIGLFIVYAAKAVPLAGPYLTFGIFLWGLGAMAALAYRALRLGNGNGNGNGNGLEGGLQPQPSAGLPGAPQVPNGS